MLARCARRREGAARIYLSHNSHFYSFRSQRHSSHVQLQPTDICIYTLQSKEGRRNITYSDTERTTRGENNQLSLFAVRKST